MPHAGGNAATGPSRLWYLFAIVIFIAGFVAMGVFLFKQLSVFGDDLVQIVVPGEVELALEPVRYTIFHETQSSVGGKLYQSNELTGLSISVVSPMGEAVALSRSGRSGSYEFAGRRGVAVLAFEISEPGTYRVSARYGVGAAGPETVLAVGKAFIGSLFVTVFGGIAIVFICAGVAVAIGVTVFLKRRRLRRAVGSIPERPPAIRFALPATKTFAWIFGGASAGLVTLLVLGNFLERALAPEPPWWIRGSCLAIFFALLLVIIYSATALMVHIVINFQSAFWRYVGRAMGSATIADSVPELTPRARWAGDIIVLAVWVIFTLALAIALPAMIRDGLFS